VLCTRLRSGYVEPLIRNHGRYHPRLPTEGAQE
jgi:hypothetical protein